MAMVVIIAASGPDCDAIDVNLDTPEIRLGLAPRCLAPWAQPPQSVHHRRYKPPLVTHRFPQLAPAAAR